MSVRVFLDTNLLIYLYSEKEPAKLIVAYDLLNKYDCVINVQSLKEASNVLYKKFKWNGTKIKKYLDNLELVCAEIIPITKSTVYKAIDIKDKYGFSLYDCVMLSSALEGNCDILFSEYMSNGQIINDTLRIVNPFKERS